MSSGLNLGRFQAGLETRVMGRTVFFLKEVDSTNEWAKHLARMGARKEQSQLRKRRHPVMEGWAEDGYLPSVGYGFQWS